MRVEVLKRMLIVGHARALAPGGPALRALAPEQRAPRPWPDYKPYAILVAIIDLLYSVMFKVLSLHLYGTVYAEKYSYLFIYLL
jgi:hypothetical protein